jgi:uncharacterized protein (DUF305 family)
MVRSHAPAPPGGGQAQRAFLSSMLPHHTSAVDMAKVARAEAESDFVPWPRTSPRARPPRSSAWKIHEELFATPLKPDEGAHVQLGLSAEAAGMDNMDGAATIRGRRPFDRAFVDEMVGHHRGAIAMAGAVKERSRSGEVRALAQGIVSAQRREIKEMDDFREQTYGAPTMAVGETRG